MNFSGLRGGHCRLRLVFISNLGSHNCFNGKARLDFLSLFAFLLAVKTCPFVLEGLSLGLRDTECRPVNEAYGFMVFRRVRHSRVR